jgi:hypothetical protein
MYTAYHRSIQLQLRTACIIREGQGAEERESKKGGEEEELWRRRM